MVELITTLGAGTVFLVLLIGIPCIIGFITWCKQLWEKRERFKQDNINEGRCLEKKEEGEEHRLAEIEARNLTLDTLVKQQADMLKELKKVTKRLEKSDRLAIKTYIKEQHDIWVPKGCIDGQVLDLLEERFTIYQEEGGNSWALRLMQDLRALPVVVVVPTEDSHE